MKKKTSLFLILLLCIVGVLTACGGESGGNSGESKPEESSSVDGSGLSDATVALGEESQWWGIDTVLLDGTMYCQPLVCETLVNRDDDGNILPGIAEKVEVSEDGLTITLTIPEDLKFASGEPLLPEDVEASLLRFQEVSPFNSDLESVESIEVDGQNVILSEFTSNLSVTLSSISINIQDKDVLESSSDDDLLWGAQPYGMYYLDEYVEGSHVVLKRNDNFKTFNPYVENKGPGYFKEITVRFMPEEFSRANALNIDDIQAMFSRRWTFPDNQRRHHY